MVFLDDALLPFTSKNVNRSFVPFDNFKGDNDSKNAFHEDNK
jgi:hypothetical protein